MEGRFIIFVAGILHLLELVFYAIEKKNHDNIFPFLHQVTHLVEYDHPIIRKTICHTNEQYKIAPTTIKRDDILQLIC
jgi:hypothetical protein